MIKKRTTKRSTKSRKSKKAEDSSDVEESDKASDGEEEEKLPEVKFPSVLNEDQKLARLGKFQSKNKKEMAKKNKRLEDAANINDESEVSDEEAQDESGENNKKLHHVL
jgi:hypothetical protein